MRGTTTLLATDKRAPRRRWGKIAAGVIGLTFLVALAILPLFTVGSPIVSVLIFLAAVTPALFYSALVILLDRNEREPTGVLLGTFLWGALVATLISGIVNTIAGALFGKFVELALSAPLIEETSKAFALLLVFFFMREEFDNVLDGIVYGSLIGIGFAMVENFEYFARAYHQGDITGFAENVYARVILGGFGHAAFTATTGAGLGYVRETNSRVMKALSPFLGWCLAVFQHFAWNVLRGVIGGYVEYEYVSRRMQLLVTSPLLTLLFLGPGVATLFFLVVLAWRREAGIIEQQLQPEVQAGWITPEEYARLTSASRRRTEEWHALRTWGGAAWHAMLDLDQAATELAFRKWHLGRGEVPKRGQKNTSEDELRQRVQLLRAHLLAAAAAAPRVL